MSGAATENGNQASHKKTIANNNKFEQRHYLGDKVYV